VAPPATTGTTAPTSVPSLAGFDVKSATLPAGTCGAGGGAPFTLTNGAWTGSGDGSPGQASLSLATTVTGAFSGGAGDDVAALFGTQPGGTTSGGCIVVWEPTATGAQVAAWTTGAPDWPGQLTGDSGLQAEGGRLSTKLFSFAASDPHCCPSIATPVVLTVAGDGITATPSGPAPAPTAAPTPTEPSTGASPGSLAGAVITTDGVGPVMLGMAVADASTASGLPAQRSGCNGSYTIGPLLLGTDAGDRVTTIATSDRGLATRSGARVGMTSAEVQAIYGAQLRKGSAQGEPIPIIATDDGRSEVVFSIVNGVVGNIVVATGTNGEYGESAGC